jgi:ectoine hydroxylase-related dioxygenase (phytanoyl-CoA dioxygenase family)
MNGRRVECYFFLVVHASAIETFQTEGAVLLRGLLDAEWIQMLRNVTPEILGAAYNPNERVAVGAGEEVEKPAVRSRDGLWRGCEPFARLLYQSPLGDTAARLMQSSTARLYEDLLLYKEAGAPAGESWHRDSPHWPLKGNQLSSTWFSLETVTSDTGAMRFVAGSHLDSDALVNAASLGVSTSEIKGRRIITLDAEPGDVVAFHPRAIHSAYGSAPDRPRRSFTIRFMGDDIRWRPRTAMYHAWMRDCGLEKGAVLDHPWFPILGRTTVLV